MHPILKSGTHTSLALANSLAKTMAMAIFLASCATGNVATVEDRRIEQQPLDRSPNNADRPYTEGDRATPLEGRDYQLENQIEHRIERAEHFRRLADNQQDLSEAVDAALSSAEFYIQANDSERALNSVRDLDPSTFTIVQSSRYQIVIAYVEYARQQYQSALDRLYALLGTLGAEETNQQRVDALLLSSFCHQALGEYDLAITNLIERESLLYGAARAETSRYIGQVINSLSIDERQRVIDNSSNATVRNRFEQSLYGRVGEQSTRPSQFDQWRGDQPISTKNIIGEQWTPGAPKSIAVLLPLSSRFNKAAQAVLDGIKYQHSLNESSYRPILRLYDIGDNPTQVSRYYAAARQSGADLIIGPLGKDYANQLSNSTQSYASNQGVNGFTILLGGDLPLNQNQARLSMGPEHQGRIVAERALKHGFVNAALLIPDSDTGMRTARAFSAEWLKNGGKLSKSVSYSPKQFDHSTELKQLFDINQSEYRHKLLSSALGFRPKFAAYRRDDIEFIFMISDNNTGRILRPQINFFSGTSMPVLASSSVYNGIQDPTNNVDLDRTSFPVMPWVLRSDEVAPYAGQLNMLFAMGSDAYRVAANFQSMRSQPDLAMQGNMGLLNFERSGNIFYQPVWAQFNEGQAEPENELIPLERPEPTRINSSSNDQDGRIGVKRYDESNWDARQSRRKAGR